jgi:DNA-binding Xre family transcriptional regulator
MKCSVGYIKHIGLGIKIQIDDLSYKNNIVRKLADKFLMDKKVYPAVYISNAGVHRIVPEADLEELLATSSAVNSFDLKPLADADLGYVIRIYRASKGLSQTDLASRAGVQPCQISLMETKVGYQPKRQTLERLCLVLGASFKAALEAKKLL